MTAQGISRGLRITCSPSSNHSSASSAYLHTHTPPPKAHLLCACPKNPHRGLFPQQTLARDAGVTQMSHVHRTAMNPQGPSYSTQGEGWGILPRTKKLDRFTVRINSSPLNVLHSQTNIIFSQCFKLSFMFTPGNPLYPAHLELQGDTRGT